MKEERENQMEALEEGIHYLPACLPAPPSLSGGGSGIVSTFMAGQTWVVAAGVTDRTDGQMDIMEWIGQQAWTDRQHPRTSHTSLHVGWAIQPGQFHCASTAMHLCLPCYMPTYLLSTSLLCLPACHPFCTAATSTMPARACFPTACHLPSSSLILLATAHTAHCALPHLPDQEEGGGSGK